MCAVPTLWNRQETIHQATIVTVGCRGTEHQTNSEVETSKARVPSPAKVDIVREGLVRSVSATGSDRYWSDHVHGPNIEPDVPKPD